MDYFRNLFSSHGEGEQETVLNLVDRKVTPEMNESLTRPFVAEEVKATLNQMHPTKSPGPDGMPGSFYH